MDIYCGNLAYATTDDGLKAAFAAYGEVTSARVVTDRMTGRSKGFGFVEMPNAEQAEAAIAALNGLDMERIILEKDKKASVKYNHDINLEQFLQSH